MEKQLREYTGCSNNSVGRRSQGASSLGSRRSTTIHITEQQAQTSSAANAAADSKKSNTRAVSVKSNDQSISVTVGVLPEIECNENDNDSYIMYSGRKESAKQEAISKAQMERLESKISELQSQHMLMQGDQQASNSQEEFKYSETLEFQSSLLEPIKRNSNKMSTLGDQASGRVIESGSEKEIAPSVGQIRIFETRKSRDSSGEVRAGGKTIVAKSYSAMPATQVNPSQIASIDTSGDSPTLRAHPGAIHQGCYLQKPQVICHTLTNHAPSMASDNPFNDESKNTAIKKVKSKLGRVQSNASSRQPHSYMFPQGAPSSSKNSRTTTQERQGFNQYMDDLVQVWVQPDKSNATPQRNGTNLNEQSQVIFHHKRRELELERNQPSQQSCFGQIEPKVVSLKLEPRTVSATAQYAAKLREAQESKKESQELFQQRQSNSFKPGRVLSKAPPLVKKQPFRQKDKPKRANTLAGRKVALKPQPRDLRKQWHLKQQKEPPVKAENGSQTGAGQQDAGIGCQADFDFDDGAITPYAAPLFQKRQSSVDPRDEEFEESLNELYLRSKHSSLYNPQQTMDNFAHSITQVESMLDSHQQPTLTYDYKDDTEPDKVQSLLMSGQELAHLNDGVTPHASRERCNSSSSSQKQRNTIVSLLRNKRQGQQSQDQGEPSTIEAPLERAQTSQHEARNQQNKVSQFNEQRSIHHTTLQPHQYAAAMLANQTLQQQQQIHADQQVIQALSGSESVVISGQTPSPLKSMAELIRQTQEQLKHLTPEMINAQVAAELASQAFFTRQQQLQSNQGGSLSTLQAQVDNRLGNNAQADMTQNQFYANQINSLRPEQSQSGSVVGRAPEQARVMVHERIDIARKTTTTHPRPSHSIYAIDKRPNTVMSVGNAYSRKTSNRKKSAEKLFVPITAVQIRAYEFSNLRVSGGAPPFGRPEPIQNRDITLTSPNESMSAAANPGSITSGTYLQNSYHQNPTQGVASQYQRIKSSCNRNGQLSEQDYILQMHKGSHKFNNDPQYLNVTHDTIYLDKSIFKQQRSIDEDVVTQNKLKVSALSSNRTTSEEQPLPKNQSDDSNVAADKRKPVNNLVDGQLMSDSNASIEDEDVFSLIRMRAKSLAPTRQSLSISNSSKVQIPIDAAGAQATGADQDESDDHTLLLTSQHDSSVPYPMEQSPNTFAIKSKLGQHLMRHAQNYQTKIGRGSVNSITNNRLSAEPVKLLATLRRNTDMSERLNSSCINETLPYDPEAEVLSSSQQMKIESKGLTFENSSDLNKQLSVKDDKNQLYGCGDNLSNEGKSTPSNQSCLRKNSRTVYSIQGSKHNSAPKHPLQNEDERQNQQNSPASRRSVFQRSISREKSPSTLEQRNKSFQNAVNTELASQLTGKEQSSRHDFERAEHMSATLIKKSGSQDETQQQQHSLSNINLYRYGKLQMLKHALKTQAYLDDMKYQLNNRAAMAGSAAQHAPQILDEQKVYLKTFHPPSRRHQYGKMAVSISRKTSDDSRKRIVFDDKRASLETMPDRAKVISQQQQRMRRKDHDIHAITMNPYLSVQNSIQSEVLPDEYQQQAKYNQDHQVNLVDQKAQDFSPGLSFKTAQDRRQKSSAHWQRADQVTLHGSILQSDKPAVKSLNTIPNATAELPNSVQTLKMATEQGSRSILQTRHSQENEADDYKSIQVVTPIDSETQKEQSSQHSFKLPKKAIACRPTHLQVGNLKGQHVTHSAATSTKAIAEPYKQVHVYSMFSSQDESLGTATLETTQENVDMKSIQSIMAKKSTNEMHRLMRRGARRGSMQRALQVNLLDKTSKSRHQNASFYPQLSKQVSIDVRDHQSQGSLEEPLVQHMTHSVHSGFTQAQNQEHYKSQQRMAASLYEPGHQWHSSKKSVPLLGSKVKVKGNVDSRAAGRQNSDKMTTISMGTMGGVELSTEDLRQASPVDTLWPGKRNLVDSKLQRDEHMRDSQSQVRCFMQISRVNSANEYIEKAATRPNPQMKLNRHESKMLLLKGNRRLRSTFAAFNNNNTRQRLWDSEASLRPIGRRSQIQSRNCKKLRAQKLRDHVRKSVQVGDDNPINPTHSMTSSQVGSVVLAQEESPPESIYHDVQVTIEQHDDSQSKEMVSSEMVDTMPKDEVHSHYEQASTRHNSQSAFYQLVNLQNLIDMVSDSNIVSMSRVDQHFAIKRARQAQKRIQQQTTTQAMQEYRPSLSSIPRHPFCISKQRLNRKKNSMPLHQLSGTGTIYNGGCRSTQTMYSSEGANGGNPLHVVISMQQQLTHESDLVTTEGVNRKKFETQEHELTEPQTALTKPLASVQSLDGKQGHILTLSPEKERESLGLKSNTPDEVQKDQDYLKVTGHKKIQ